MPLGDSAAYIEFSTTLDLEVNSVVQRLALLILKQKVPWIRDVVPALGGVALHFDPDHEGFPAEPLEAALEIVNGSLKESLEMKDDAGREVERRRELDVRRRVAERHDGEGSRFSHALSTESGR